MHVIDLTANYSNMHLFNFSKCFDLIMFNQNDKTGPGENHRLNPTAPTSHKPFTTDVLNQITALHFPFDNIVKLRCTSQ